MSEASEDHPIDIAPFEGRVVVTHGNTVIADTARALAMHEADYPVVFYVPKADVAMNFLDPTDHSTHCPYKGDASYWSVESGGERAENAVWAYVEPLPGVAEIKDHVAFYPKKVSIKATPTTPAL
ncbi:DUF427 domain-containing protein [Amorphus sp. 3PC139-8]|uniref:DUF427 domain-containing protein n=1 Tax=Amorphus sp. 3PC139-8 TaxID=2735676 RepID=UPI00345DB2A7